MPCVLIIDKLPTQFFLFVNHKWKLSWPYCSYKKAILSRVSSFRNKIMYYQIKNHRKQGWNVFRFLFTFCLLNNLKVLFVFVN